MRVFQQVEYPNLVMEDIVDSFWELSGNMAITRKQKRRFNAVMYKVRSCCNTGDYTGAKDKLIDLLDVCKEDFGENDPITLKTMENLANVYHSLYASMKTTFGDGKYLYLLQEAENLLVSVLEKCENKSKNIPIFQQLAIILISEQKYESAAEYAEYCYTERKKLLGEDHADTLTSMHYFGFAKGMTGKDVNYGTNGILNDCLKRRTRVLGASHKDTLSTDNALKKRRFNAVMNEVRSCCNTGDYTGAKDKLIDLLDVSKEDFGENDPITIKTMENLAKVYYSLYASMKTTFGDGKYLYLLQEAENLLVSVLEKCENKSKKHPYFPTTCNHIDIRTKIRISCRVR
jgi:hypothetical protein